MIDWDIDSIKKVESHYNNIFNPKLDLIYFTKTFESMYRFITNEGEVLPDLLNDLTYYTKDGINAKYKLIMPTIDDDKTKSELARHRLKQKIFRKEALEKSVDSYFNYLLEDIEEFTDKYPQYQNILRQWKKK